MSLPVEKMVNQRMMENTECILCGTYVDGCKEGAIDYNWGKFNSAKAKSQKPY
jgi:ferredoxin